MREVLFVAFIRFKGRDSTIMAIGILKSPVSEGDSNPYNFGRDIAG